MPYQVVKAVQLQNEGNKYDAVDTQYEEDRFVICVVNMEF